MKDLKSFKNTAQSPEETLNKYKDLTDDELIGLLISQVKKAKENGELDAEQTFRGDCFAQVDRRTTAKT